MTLRPEPETHGDRVAQFVFNACPDHQVRGRPAHTIAWHTAERLLRRHPELARTSFHAAVVCGDLAEVERVLAERPAAAIEKCGPKNWEPLLYLCFTRLGLTAANEHALAIARTLLDRGADPNVYFMAGDSRYTPLVGAIGMGEEARPPHAQAAPLARLLLEHGADPYDLQVIYNIAMSRTDVRWVLELLHTHCIRTGREADWNDPEWRMFDMGDYGSGARWLLGHAVAEDDLALAEWLLVHGASPNAAPPADPRWRNRSLHEEALCGNSTEMAELLARFGATVSHLERTGIDAFASACLRMDVALVQTLAAAHPEYLRSPMALFAAAKHDRADVLALLQELGASSEVEDAQHQRALHVAAYAGALRAAGLLIEHGAEPDPRESRWGATPLGFAAHAMIQPMIDLLSTVSRDVFELTFAGKVERVREVLAAEPALARTIHPDGETPLMRLPNDEVAALALARLLLAHGADPAQRDSRGATAADMAARRGLEAVAALLRAAFSGA